MGRVSGPFFLACTSAMPPRPDARTAVFGVSSISADDPKETVVVECVETVRSVI